MLFPKSKKYIAIGLIFHIIAIIFSIGFYRHDEQREILQMVGHKLEMYDASYLSFQFHSEIRPVLQPMFYVWCSQIYLFFFDLNPHHLAVLLRLVSSLFGISSLWVLYKTFEDKLKNIENQTWYFFFAGLLYFLPFLHARTSNENLSASFFIFGLYFLRNKETWKNAFYAGMMFGICFVLRFQLIVMITSTILWFLIFQKYSFKKYLALTGTFLAVVGFNTFIDSYYYGHFSFTPFNYIYVNIIQKYVNEFGVTPFYDYFIQAFKDGPPPLSLLFIISYLALWIKFPKSLLTWMTLPFFIVHSLIGHKEFRFIFPIVFLLPYILTFLIMELQLKIERKWKILFLVFNIPLLIYFSFVPASNLMKYYEHLYSHENRIDKVYISAPFEDYTKFYLKNDIQYVLYKPQDLKKLITSDKKVYFFTMTLKERDLVLENPQCKNDFSLFPKWIYDFEIIKKRRTFRSWTLVECSNQ